MTAHLKRQPFCVDCIAGRSPGGHPAPFGAQNWPKNLIFLRLTFITHTFKNEYQYNSKTTECTKCRRHFNIKDIYFFMWELCFVREFHVRFIPIWRSVCDANREFYTAGKVIIRSPSNVLLVTLNFEAALMILMPASWRELRGYIKAANFRPHCLNQQQIH